MKLAYILMFTLLISGCINRDEIYANPPAKLTESINAILPAATEYVKQQEKIAQEKGEPLNEQALAIAKRIGIQHPEKVHVYYSNTLPFPTDPTLAQLAKKSGYAGPNMAGYTYGYGIWIKNKERDNRELLAHELIHVRQFEQRGVQEQIRQYLMQIYIYGYNSTPLEIEAYSEAKNYI
ncbi:DUF4157 domain-containing protein [Photobacterium sp. GB-3]|uniref:DUF4157 domain-containing protein n=1 Tax=Photobacterium sp. GB-3 TaxID=2022110 RepID=UPI001E543A34|nr:DUF4157 domain-containing protein [Photobacterium sp. GB-3]